jgi:hypothetical protein
MSETPREGIDYGNQTRDLSQIFDTDNFETLEHTLQTLIDAGVEEIKVGTKVYSPSQIMEYAHTTKKFTEQFPNATPKELNSFLARINVTGKKTSEIAKQGLRDCLVACAIAHGTSRGKNIH